ncbi:hypothetical protein MferCBS49748_003648 [Microsporum ferrugineum]
MPLAFSSSPQEFPPSDSFLSALAQGNILLTPSSPEQLATGPTLPVTSFLQNTGISDIAGYTNYNDHDMDLTVPIDDGFNFTTNFAQDSSNDTDDGWQDDQWAEPPDGSGSLIENSELSGFELDKLPHPRVGMANGSVSTDSEQDANDAEHFYPSDDEDSYHGSESICGKATSPPAPGQANVDNNNNNGPITPPTEQSLAPLSIVQFALPDPGDNYFDAFGADTDNADLSMYTESMDDIFLPLSFHLNSPPAPASNSTDTPLTQVMNSLTIGGGYDGLDSMRQLHQAFTRFIELVTSSVGILPLPSAYFPRICQVLGKFSHLHQQSMGIMLRYGVQLTELAVHLLRASGCTSEDAEASDFTIPPLPDESIEDLLSTNAQSSEQSIIPPPENEPEHQPEHHQHLPLLTQEEYETLHEPTDYSPFFIPPIMVLHSFNSYTSSILLANPLAPVNNANQNKPPAFERNLTVEQFIRQWYIRSRVSHERFGVKEPYPPISGEAIHVLQWPRPTKISRPEDHKNRLFDIQNIPWTSKLNVDRAEARALRDRWYTSYHNLRFQPHGFAVTPQESENYFKAKTMYTKYKATMAHFQLRNLMAVTASNTVQYVHRNKVYSVTPFYDMHTCIVDLSESISSNPVAEPLKISTMKAKHGVTVVGGFSGEYAYKGEVHDYQKVEGRITKHLNGITNHIDIVKHRTSRNPQAVIASNDECIRILDCETNKFVGTHRFARAINCTDTSPDGRLRVIVGDAADSWVVDSETGKPVQCLSGHRDYGFACAWSPDMLHIATSNQDKTVNIWDARMWRILQTIDSDVAGYRSLRFSPVGGGPRTLLMCEPADRIVIVNAQTYETRQVHDFFGEIGGADFTPDGGRIWVSNMDSRFGGLMEYDRIQWGQEFGIGHTRRSKIESRGDVYHPDLPNEWLPEADLDDDPRCVLSAGERRIRYERLMSDTEFAKLNRFLG